MQILRMMICLFMINGTFVLKPIYAQEHWGKEDSIKLSKMLNGEMPIYINKKIKIEFEKSLLEHPQIEDYDEWKKYLNFKHSLTEHWLSPIDDDILTNHFLQTYEKMLEQPREMGEMTLKDFVPMSLRCQMRSNRKSGKCKEKQNIAGERFANHYPRRCKI